MTNKEKEALVKAAFPGIDGVALNIAIGQVKTGDTVATYKNRIKEAPEVLGGGLFTPKDILKVGPVLAKGGTKVAELAKAQFAKKATEEGVKTAAKMSKKKKLAIGAVGIYAGSKATQSIASALGGNKDETGIDVQTQAEMDMANAVAAANAAGIDVNQIINTPAGSQLNLNSGNLPALMAKFGQESAGLVGIGNVGVYTGNRLDKTGPKGIVYKGLKPEIVSLPQWNKQFPSDLKGLTETKQKFVDAGIIDPTAGIDKVKAAWEAYGKMSLEYSRAGNTLSPWDILGMQKSLSGSGGTQTSIVYDTSPMAEGDVRTYAKRQLAQSLGLANVDDKQFKDILAIVRKKEAKSPTKTVTTTTGKVTRRKTTPGYGTTDVLADIEEYAKQDPRYAEFQTADVFGNAIVKALGLKS